MDPGFYRRISFFSTKIVYVILTDPDYKLGVKNIQTTGMLSEKAEIVLGTIHKWRYLKRGRRGSPVKADLVYKSV